MQVKESLNHVQVLLDHQLMDMAWSDNLTDCEENLLKVSTHLQVPFSLHCSQTDGKNWRKFTLKGYPQAAVYVIGKRSPY